MITNKINKFKQFWEKKNVEFLNAYCPGDYFVSKRYEAAKPFLDNPGEVFPEDILPDSFKADYLRIYELYNAVEGDGVYTAVPFIGMPWLEAMAGCRILSTSSSFIAEKPLAGGENVITIREDNRWIDLYMQFTDMLCEISQGRFAVGQPILRGPCDLLGELFGQKELVYLFYDEPELISKLFDDYICFFLDITKKQKEKIKPFYGGYLIGFYDLWCPGECIWFQDDLTSLLSPAIYEKYVLPVHKRLAALYKYSLIHLHPSSFYILDYLLDIPELGCIQVNKDVGGPPVKDMLPFLLKIQKKKNLVVSGDFTDEELDLIKEEIPPQGVYLIRIDSPD